MNCATDNTTERENDAISCISSGEHSNFISDELRQHIEAVVEDVVLQGKKLVSYQEKLTNLTEAESLEFDTLETNLLNLSSIIERWRLLRSDEDFKKAKDAARDCFLSDAFLDGLLMKVDKDWNTIKKRKRVRKAREFPLPIMLMMVSIAMAGFFEIKTTTWLSCFPLYLNIVVAVCAYEKWEIGALKPGFIFRSGLFMLVIFGLTILCHWWMILLTPFAVYFFFTKVDI